MPLQFCFSPSSAAHHSYHPAVPPVLSVPPLEVTIIPAVVLSLTVLNLNCLVHTEVLVWSGTPVAVTWVSSSVQDQTPLKGPGLKMGT